MGKIDNYRVTIACHLAEAKRICLARGITFKSWVQDHVKLSYDESKKLARAGGSDDPARAIEDMRTRSRERTAKSRVRRSTPGTVDIVELDENGKRRIRQPRPGELRELLDEARYGTREDIQTRLRMAWRGLPECLKEAEAHMVLLLEHGGLDDEQRSTMAKAQAWLVQVWQMVKGSESCWHP